ncbi:Dbl homology domain-containing protein, partial [Limtongia smithiae]|uniref:Dbl homology domain-containing protein n=1 Tax=Limtongia smithiae TaxID=1125753 RepID=UPI0034CFECAD
SEASTVSNLKLIRGVNSDYGSAISLSSGGSITRLDLSSAESMRAQRRKMCVEEFITSEEAYVSGLRILINTYFATSPAGRTYDISAGLYGSALELLELHQDILCSLYSVFPTLFAPSCVYSGTFLRKKKKRDSGVSAHSLTDASWKPPAIDTTSPIVASTVGGIIARKTRQIAIYEKYCLFYNSVIEVLKACAAEQVSHDRWQATWSRATQNIAMATQSRDRHADLSFSSLAIWPTTRVMKYRLLLEELCRNTLHDDSPSDLASLEESLSSVKASLVQLDASQSTECSRNTKASCRDLWNRLVFFSTNTVTQSTVGPSFPAEYLGPAILCGALHTCWISSDTENLWVEYFAAFLFKSYLVLASGERSDRYLVKFMIPLCCAQDAECRLFAARPLAGTTSFKVSFEHAFAIYEILLTTMNSVECETWVDQLSTQICACGGGCAYDFMSFDMSRMREFGPG